MLYLRAARSRRNWEDDMAKHKGEQRLLRAALAGDWDLVDDFASELTPAEGAAMLHALPLLLDALEATEAMEAFMGDDERPVVDAVSAVDDADDADLRLAVAALRGPRASTRERQAADRIAAGLADEQVNA